MPGRFVLVLVRAKIMFHKPQHMILTLQQFLFSYGDNMTSERVAQEAAKAQTDTLLEGGIQDQIKFSMDVFSYPR